MIPFIITGVKGLIMDRTIKKIADLASSELNTSVFDDEVGIRSIKEIKKIQDNSKPFYQSKKFWFTVVSALVPILNKVFNIGLNTEEVATLMAPLIAYVATLAYKESKNV